jgi:hypothetical protein
MGRSFHGPTIRLATSDTKGSLLWRVCRFLSQAPCCGSGEFAVRLLSAVVLSANAFLRLPLQGYGIAAAGGLSLSIVSA